MSNSAIYSNRTDRNGGGVYNTYGSVTNCTVYGNSTANDGGGIYTRNASVKNCIIWNNSNRDIDCNSYNPGTVSYSSYKTGENIEGDHNMHKDPLFVDAENNNFHLQEGSPCIDSGANSDAPDTDMEGISRPWGNGYDIGAYEYNVVKTAICDNIYI